METKTCSYCKKQKSILEFANDKYRPDGFTCQCKECIRNSKKKYRKTEKGKLAEKRYNQSEKGKLVRKKIDLKYNYGLTIEQHKDIYKFQNGCCAICHKPIKYDKIQTDHDHTTNKFRGLLCKLCNTRTGWFESKKLEILKYLEK